MGSVNRDGLMDVVANLRIQRGLGQRCLVVSAGNTVTTDVYAVVCDRDMLRVEERAARAQLRQDAPPIRVVPIERTLHELTVGNARKRAASEQACPRAASIKSG